MAQNVLVGTLGQAVAGLYPSQSNEPVLGEEVSTGGGGMGIRMTSVRQYWRWFTKPFYSGSGSTTVPGGIDKTYFDSGHSVVISVSNMTGTNGGPSTFTFKNMVAGTYNAVIDDMFARIAALAFDTTATGSFGGITQPFVYFILQHEVDRGAANNKLYGTDTPADYVAAWQFIWNRWQSYCTAHGVSPARIRWCWNITGFSITRSDPYYPGSQYVDVIGVDPYASTSTTNFNALNSSIWPYIRAKNKPMAYCETNCVRPDFADSNTAANWWATVAPSINALDITVEFLNIFVFPDNTPGYAINKLTGGSAAGHAYPLIHAAILTMISNLGNNAPRTVVTQPAPSGPPGVVSVVSSADGTQITLTVAANPSGDNITGRDWFIGAGFTTLLHKDNGSPTAAGTLSYTFSGLNPGQPYTVAAVAINAGGRSGFSDPTAGQIVTKNPGVSNHAPIIITSTTTPQALDPRTIDFAATATDPDGDPLTYKWTVTGPTGIVTTLSTASGSLSFLIPGAYGWRLDVSDNGSPALTTTNTGTFIITSSGAQTTDGFGWVLPQAGDLVNNLAPIIRSWLPDIDAKLTQALNTKSNHNVIHGLVASTFDPGLATGGSFNTPSASQFMYAACKLEGVGFSGLVSAIGATQQIGSGVHCAFYDANGTIFPDGILSGAAIDAIFTSSNASVSSVLDNPIVSRTYGEIIYIGFWWPASGVTQFPTIRITTSGSVNAKINLSAQPRWGYINSLSDCPSVIPFGSWVNTAGLPFIGAF